MESLTTWSDAGSQVKRGTMHWGLIAIFYSMTVMWGVRSAYSGKNSLLDLIYPYSVPFVLGIWVISDSIARGRPIPLLSRSWIVGFATFAFPVYVIWSRGWRGAGLLCLHFLVAYFICFLAMFVSYKLIFG